MTARAYVILIVIGYLLIVLFAYSHYNIVNIPQIREVEAFQTPAEPIDGTKYLIDGLPVKGRFPDMPSFNDIYSRVVIPDCNSYLDPTTLNFAGNQIDVGNTVGSFCDYIQSMNPIRTLRSVIVGTSSNNNGYTFSKYNNAITKSDRQSNNFIELKTVANATVKDTANLPVKYTRTPGTNPGTFVVRPATKYEYLSDVLSFRPDYLMPKKITEFEAYYVSTNVILSTPTSINSFTANFDPDPSMWMPTKDSPANILNITPFILGKIQYKDIIGLPNQSSTQSAYQTLRSDKVINVNIGDCYIIGFVGLSCPSVVMSYIASHPLLKEPLSQGNPDARNPVPGDLNLNWVRRDSTLPSKEQIHNDLFLTSQINCPNMFSMAYSVNNGTISKLSNSTVPMNTWNFNRVSIYNGEGVGASGYRTDVITERNSSIAIELLRYLRQDIFIEYNNSYDNINSINWSGNLNTYIKQRNSALASSKNGLMVVRWKIEGNNAWKYDLDIGTGYKRISLSSLSDVGKELLSKFISPYIEKPVIDYTIQYTFSICLKILAVDDRLRVVFSHGLSQNGNMKYFPALSIIPNNQTSLANSVVVSIMTQDNSLIHGELIPVNTSQVPLGRWMCITVSLNDRKGKIYVMSNASNIDESSAFMLPTLTNILTTTEFSIGKKPIWPFNNEPIVFAPSYGSDPSELPKEPSQCMACEANPTNTSFDNFAVAKFFWFPVELPASYVKENLFPNPTLDNIPLLSPSLIEQGTINRTIQPYRKEYTTSGTYEFYVPERVKEVILTLIGAGGGGSNTANTWKMGYGGSAGQVIKKTIPVIEGGYYGIIIGQRGLGANSPGITTTNLGIAGSSGGDTVFGNSLLVARGGAGGSPDRNSVWEGRNGQDVVIFGQKYGTGGMAWNGNTPLERRLLNASGYGAGGGNVDNNKSYEQGATCGPAGGGDIACYTPAGDGAPGYMLIEWNI